MNYFIKWAPKGTLYHNQLIVPTVVGSRIEYVDIETGVITFGAELYSARGDQIRYTAAVHIGGGKILFAPWGQKSFTVFDTVTKDQSTFEVESINPSEEGELFWEYAIYQNNLFLFPSYANSVLKMEMDTNFVEKNEKLTRDIDLLIGKSGKPYFGSKIQYDGKNILLAGWSDNFIVKLDLDTLEQQIIIVENEIGEKGFRDIALYENYLYTVNHRFHVLKYNKETFRLIGRVRILKECSLIKKTGVGICFVPAYEEDYAICDSSDNQIRRMPYPKECLSWRKGEKDNVNILIAEDENYYLVARLYGNTIDKIEKRTGQVRHILFKYDNSIMKHIYNDNEHQMFFEKEDIPTENGLFIRTNLNDFISNVSKKEGM